VSIRNDNTFGFLKKIYVHQSYNVDCDQMMDPRFLNHSFKPAIVHYRVNFFLFVCFIFVQKTSKTKFKNHHNDNDCRDIQSHGC